MGRNTHQLIEDYLEMIQFTKMHDNIAIEEGSDIHLAIKEAKRQEQIILDLLLQKVDNIDNFVIHLEEKMAKLDAVKKVHKDEADRIQKRINSVKTLKDRMNKVFIPMIIETVGKDGVLETSSARYSMYETWGKMLYDPKKVPEDYRS